MRVLLARPRGFCAGVERAIEAVERALETFGPPVYVRHEIIHNQHVVEALRARGAIFVDELSNIPAGAVTIFSAHGVSRRVEETAHERGLPVIDATCPLVSKVHHEAARFAAAGRDIILIGHESHAEVEGTKGRIATAVHVVSTTDEIATLKVADPRRLAYVTQTTLSVDDTRDLITALRKRFPTIIGPHTSDICYATQNRQHAVRELARTADLILIVGARNSSNSNRLREIAVESGVNAYLIPEANELDPRWLDSVSTIGVSAGASAPEFLVTQLVDRLLSLGASVVDTLPGVEENVQFRMPAMPPRSPAHRASEAGSVYATVSQAAE